MKLLITAALVSLGTTTILTQDKDSSMTGCPMMADHGAMNERGDKGMGFSQEKTTHRFRLAPDGGAIEVSTNDQTDEASRAQIRMHLGHIAKMFTQGNFQTPMFVHDKMPEGAKTMQEMKSKIAYHYEETQNGGGVRIQTENQQAVAAVHEFLRFQITEHETGDPTDIR